VGLAIAAAWTAPATRGTTDPSGTIAPQPQPASPRIVAIADIHGSAAGLVEILRAAGLVGADRKWTGGTARLVQTGDFLDRGQTVREVMDLLMRLEGEARRAGGRVDVLFGNHEGMNVLHDTRDVSTQAYATFQDGRSEERRRKAFDVHAAIAKKKGNTLAREEWMTAHPPGYVEYMQALGESGQYGRWIRARKVVLQIGDTIFMHAGLRPDTTATLDDVNRGVEREIKAWDDLVETLTRLNLIAPFFTLSEIVDAAQLEIGRIGLAQKTGEPLPEYVTREFAVQLQQLSGVDKWAMVDGDGPLWYRGLATLPDSAESSIATLLGRYDARRFVTGHTPQLPGRIKSRFGGRAFLIDTGMLTSYFKGGRPSALEIQDGRLTAIYTSGRESLSDSSGPASKVGLSTSPVFAAANAH
jgi:Calcineurin-like phosphoesterase